MITAIDTSVLLDVFAADPLFGPGSRAAMEALAGDALHHADRLLTRDRGFYRTYFRKLPVVDPAARR